jgi:putative membrane protein insertion efficiency factor
MTPAAHLALTLIRIYQLAFSPLFGGACRFVPSCSEYAREAVHTHGAARGLLLTVRRLSRCHPFGKAGLDQVPAAGKSR